MIYKWRDTFVSKPFSSERPFLANCTCEKKRVKNQFAIFESVNKNLGNGHPDHGLLSEELSKGLTVLRSSSIHALEHFVKHILHLHFAITLDRMEGWRVTSKPISAET